MKKMLSMLFLFLLILSCRKDQTNDQKEEQPADPIKSEEPVTVETQYCNWDWVLSYRDEEDVGKKYAEIKSKGSEAYYWLNFGDEVTVLAEKEINDQLSYQYRNPDDTVFWVEKRYLVEKFVVINQTDIDTYRQPVLTSITNLKVQPGDLGVYKAEKNGFVQVEFWAYQPAKKDGDKIAVGTKWIEKGYTTDVFTARQAYYLYRAYRFEINDDLDKATEYVEKALEANGGKITDITSVVENYSAELKAKPADS